MRESLAEWRNELNRAIFAHNPEAAGSNPALPRRLTGTAVNRCDDFSDLLCEAVA